MRVSPHFNLALISLSNAVDHKMAIPKTHNKEISAFALAGPARGFQRMDRFVSIRDSLQLLVPDLE